MQSIFSLTYMKWLYVDVCSSCFQSNWIWCLSCKAYLVCVHGVPRGCLANSNPIYSFGFTATIVEAVCALWKHIVSIQESNSSFLCICRPFYWTTSVLCFPVSNTPGMPGNLLELFLVLEIYWKVTFCWKLSGSVQPSVVNVPASSCMSMVFNIVCTKSPVENILQ